MHEIVDGLHLDGSDNDPFLAHLTEQLLMSMPVMSVSKGGPTAIVNMHEFLFAGDRDSFADLLLLDRTVNADRQSAELDKNETSMGGEEEPQVVHHVPLKLNTAGVVC